MPRHTIETLSADFRKFKTEVNKRFDTMQPQVQEMHDFIVEQKGYERGLTYKKDGSININKDAWGLIIKLVLIIAALVGIKQLTG